MHSVIDPARLLPPQTVSYFHQQVSLLSAEYQITHSAIFAPALDVTHVFTHQTRNTKQQGGSLSCFMHTGSCGPTLGRPVTEADCHPPAEPFCHQSSILCGCSLETQRVIFFKDILCIFPLVHPQASSPPVFHLQPLRHGSQVFLLYYSGPFLLPSVDDDHPEPVRHPRAGTIMQLCSGLHQHTKQTHLRGTPSFSALCQLLMEPQM